jgi:hypothetical protein
MVIQPTVQHLFSAQLCFHSDTTAWITTLIMLATFAMAVVGWVIPLPGMKRASLNAVYVTEPFHTQTEGKDAAGAATLTAEITDHFPLLAIGSM